jgi:hypothetical protein
MLNIQEAIRSLVQQELNKNTQGLDFEVSLYNVKTNDLLENTLTVGNTYATEQKRFIPVLIEDISGEYADLQNLTASELFINTSFLIPVDNTDLNNIVIEETYQKVATALDQFRVRTNARTLPLGTPKYLLNKDYKLQALNIPKVLASSYIELDFSFWGEEDGLVLTDTSNNFSLIKLGNNLRFTLSNQTFDYPIQLNKQYNVIIFDTGDNTVQISFFDGSTATIEVLSNVTYNPQNLVLGGSYLSMRRFTFGGNVFGSPAPVYDLRNFKTYQPVVGTADMVSLSSTLFKVTPVYEFGSTGNVVLGFSVPNPTSNQFTMGNGLNYQQFELSMTAFVTDSVFVGNDVRYFLDAVEIFPFFRDESFVSETDPSQVVSQQITKHTVVQSAIGREYSIYFKNDVKLLELFEKFSSLNPNPNQVFNFKIEYPLFERQYPVLITQTGFGISNSQPISISIKFELASNILI